MAIISMKKLTLVGLSSERNKILKTLHRLGCVEISSVSDLDNTVSYTDAVYRDKLSTKISKINFTFTFLKDNRMQALKLSEKYKKLAKETEPVISDSENNSDVKALVEYVPPKKPLMLGLPGVQYDVFDNIINKEEELFEIIEQIDKLNSKLIDIKSDMIRLSSLMEQLTPYLQINAKLSDFQDTKHISINLGLIPNNKLSLLDDIKSAFPDAVIEVYPSAKYSAVVVISNILIKEELLTRLTDIDYVNTNLQYDITPQEKLKECQDRYSQLEQSRENIIIQAIGYEQFINDLEILYDYYLLELKKAEADNKFKFTGSTFTMQGWFPKEIEDKLVNKLNNEFTVYVDTQEPIDNEVVPTFTRNNSFVSPYEDITNMYSTPNSREIDPNPFVAIFYFMFFGIMVSDAGYGIILALGAYLLYRYTKPRKGEGKLVLVIAMGGVSTILWGIMFGGWFGMELKPLLFSPLENPLAMLGLSLGLGIFQIVFGMGIRAVSLFREKKYLDAVCNIFGWYAVFLGIALFAISAVPNLEFFKTIGMVAALIGVLGVLIGGGIGQKSIGGKIAGGFANIYSVTGYLSDILSYSRLFGLGLATGVVGMVINKLAEVVVDLVPFGIGYAFAIPILIGGHIFNIAINTLGAYVHNSRLQYIEFFSRFYTGSGHQFVPFGSNTKYIYIDN